MIKNIKFQNKIYLLKFNSIFVKTLLILFILIFMVIILFYYFVNGLYKEKYKEQITYSSFSILSANIMEMDSLVHSLEVQMSDMLHDSECTSIIISGNTFQNTKALNIASELFNLTQRNKYATKAWIYIKQSDSILSSDKSIVLRSDFADNSILKAYEETEDKKTNLSHLFFYNNKLYLFQDFPLKKHLSTMCIEIDSKNLFDLVSENIQGEDGNIYVYLKGNPIFTEQIQYPSDEKLQITNRNRIDARKTTCETADSEYTNILTYKSDVTGLTALMFLNSNSISPSLQTIIYNMSTFLVVILLLLLIASIFLVRNIYKPIHSMVSNILEQRNINKYDEWENINNELELIQNVYKENKNQKLILGNMLHEVGSAVSERLFHSILNKEEMNEERVEAILKQIDSPFSIEGEYQVLILEWMCRGKILLTEIKNELHKIDFAKFGSKYLNKGSYICCLDGKNNQKILVLHSNKYSNIKYKHMIHELEEYIQRELNDTSIQLIIGIGRVYKHIFNITLSYKDAESNLNQRLYFTSGQDKKNEQDIISLYYNQIKMILEEIMDNPEKGLVRLRQLVDRVVEFPELAATIYLTIMDLIFVKLIYLNINREDRWLQQKKQIETDLSPLSENDERVKIMECFCQETIQVISEAANKEQFRHLENAKRYIELHYNNSSLSLNSVSEVCGISSSYLSRIFVEYLSSGFVEYLNNYRIEQAKRLMITTNLTIADIGFSTGFNSPQNFIRVFKKYQGETPGQYRGRCSVSDDCIIDGVGME